MKFTRVEFQFAPEAAIILRPEPVQSYSQYKTTNSRSVLLLPANPSEFLCIFIFPCVIVINSSKSPRFNHHSISL